MREIRFRAWDKKNKRMESWENLNGIPAKMWTDNLDLIPMQFTGTLDRNGKEVWEGDLVKNRHDEVFPVVFYKYMFCLEIKKDNGTSWTGFNYNYPFEVIGNIYENKELIK